MAVTAHPICFLIEKFHATIYRWFQFMPREIVMSTTKFIAAPRLRELQQLETWRTAAAFIFDWIAIAAIIAVSEYIGGWLIYFVAIILIAGRMHAIASLIHEFAHVRFVLDYPLQKGIVAQIPASGPACWRFVRGCVMHPEPAAGALLGIGGQLRANPLAGERAIPPGADAKKRVFKDKRRAV